jgi:hypothetical protein
LKKQGKSIESQLLKREETSKSIIRKMEDMKEYAGANALQEPGI